MPWLALVIGCSLVSALLIVSLTWLPTMVSGLMVAPFGGAFGAAVVLYPQLASQLLAAGQPGLVLGLAAVAIQAVIRWQVRRRVTHLPGFTRTPVEPSAVVGPSTASGTPVAASVARSRPGSTGTPAPAPSGS